MGMTAVADATGNLFLGLTAVTTGFVLGQANVNKEFGSVGIWCIVVLLFLAGVFVTSFGDFSNGYSYQFGNAAMELGGAFLACAIAKTIFNGGVLKSLSPQIKILFLLLFLGGGIFAAFMGREVSQPGWSALFGFLLCASGGLMGSVAEDVICSKCCAGDGESEDSQTSPSKDTDVTTRNISRRPTFNHD